MSISSIQRKIIKEEITKYYLTLGIKPRDIDIDRDMSLFFFTYPIGSPFEITEDDVSTGAISNVDAINENMVKASLNLATLMEAIRADVIRSMDLNTAVKDRLKRTKAKQARLSSRIDDYLIASNNTKGYFYSYTERFPDNSLVDLSYTTAYVDNDSGKVSIPHSAIGSDIVPKNGISGVQVIVHVDGKQNVYNTISPFEYAIDGLSNTGWEINVSADKQASVVVELTISISNARSSNAVSQIDIEPITSSPMTVSASINNDIGRSNFGLPQEVVASKMSFVDVAKNVSTITLTMAKSRYDRIVDINNSSRYVYVFGASEISVAKKLYDNSAVLVSKPIELPLELAKSHTIDKVRLDVVDNIPDSASIDYYIAQDNTSATSISDFSWHYLDPKSKNEDLKILSFGGSEDVRVNIVPLPGRNDLKLIDPDSSSLDLSLRNPSSNIISGASIYRIAEFKDLFIQNSIFLEEGIDTTRIISIPLDTESLSGLSFWKSYINDSSTGEEAYGSINDGHSFFYGGDVGANGKSVYIETFLVSASDHPVVSKEFKKVDNNAKLWDIKVYLNGAEVAYLPVGTNSAMIPWKFHEGENHIAVVVNIPEATQSNTSPYLGSIDIMSGSRLSSWGTLRLAEWKYLDMFHMEHNDIGDTKTFTIYNNELVSRKIPTTNMRLRYIKSTESGPEAVRLKAELNRDQDSDMVTPIIKQYSVKFSYGGKQ